MLSTVYPFMNLNKDKMKKIILIPALMLVFGLGSGISKDREPKKISETAWLTSQIYDMLADNAIPKGIRGSKAEIRIAMADDGVFRMLSVDSNNSNLKFFLRENIDVKHLNKGRKDVVYVIPIEIAE